MLLMGIREPPSEEKTAAREATMIASRYFTILWFGLQLSVSLRKDLLMSL
jgi:hypothetical protein